MTVRVGQWSSWKLCGICRERVFYVEKVDEGGKYLGMNCLNNHRHPIFHDDSEPENQFPSLPATTRKDLL
jgi:hypothetical protein